MGPLRFSSAILLNFINFVLAVIELLIVLRIALKFFSANNSAPFVSWVYGTTDPLLRPFLGMFPNPVLEGGFLIEFSAVFGLIVYAVVGYLIAELISFVHYHSRYGEVRKK